MLRFFGLFFLVGSLSFVYSCGSSSPTGVTISGLESATFDRSTRSCDVADSSLLENPQLDNDGDVERISFVDEKMTVRDQDSAACDFQWSYTITGLSDGEISKSYNSDFSNISSSASDCATNELVSLVFQNATYTFELSSSKQIIRMTGSAGDSEACTVYIKS